MGWFDDQIHTRKQNDDEAFFEAFENISSAVKGKRISAALNDNSIITEDAVRIILQYYHVKITKTPASLTDMNEKLEHLLRPNGIAKREVELKDDWYKDAFGAMLGVLKSDGSVVALIPTGFSGYSYYDRINKKLIKIGRHNHDIFENNAYAFYKPFPLKKLSLGALVKYSLQTLSMTDYIFLAIATLAVTLVGLITPKISNTLFSTVVDSGSIRLLISLATFLICVNISTALLTTIQNLIAERVNIKLSVTVQAATMLRLMSLPASFFKSYSSGDLSTRVESVNELCDVVISILFSTGLTSVFSLIYIVEIVQFTPTLALPALIFTLLSIISMVLISIAQMKHNLKVMDGEGHENGLTYSLITGIQKIRLSGAEKRVFAKWGNHFAEVAHDKYNPPAAVKLSTVITTSISLLGTLVIYLMAYNTDVSIADYYAFNTAYGMIAGALAALSQIVLLAATIKPTLERIKPIIEATPEISEGKQILTRFSGNIELNNVSFRYSESMPFVLKNLSLKIHSGQYVAIVGKTGCGKSTLMRLMLGLETPNKGAIYFDGKDISSLEPKSVRQKVGSVMQNGKLFAGDIYSNIVISAPWLKLDDAWRAAELAGIAEDIKRMPMGMSTIVSEGTGGFSGGQKQRLMIARALAPSPKVLMFDEATSALDNITQKNISNALDSLNCTRIVIAHRLSTIKHCDRILVLDGGQIIEDGTYEELINQGGFFAELVDRQLIDSKLNN